MACSPAGSHSRTNNQSSIFEAPGNVSTGARVTVTCVHKAIDSNRTPRPARQAATTAPYRTVYRTVYRTFKFLEKLLYCSMSSGLTDLRARPRASCEDNRRSMRSNISRDTCTTHTYLMRKHKVSHFPWRQRQTRPEHDSLLLFIEEAVTKVSYSRLPSTAGVGLSSRPKSRGQKAWTSHG